MSTKIKQDYFEIEGSDSRIINMDIHYKESNKPQPIVIFAHGYKGFKDFGVWSLIGDEFAKSGIVFVRFNFSHNGVTPKTPVDFSDLEAFGQNNFSKELFDFSTVIEFISNKAEKKADWDSENINIIGHSRGGGMAILTASEQKKVKKLITWAAIESTSLRLPKGEELIVWEKAGVAYVKNGRTGQDMPHYFQFYNNYIENKERFDIKEAIKNINVPILIVHGTDDETVGFDAAKLLVDWAVNSRLFSIEDGDHSFGSKHPWENDELPDDFRKVVDESINFIKSEIRI